MFKRWTAISSPAQQLIIRSLNKNGLNNVQVVLKSLPYYCDTCMRGFKNAWTVPLIISITGTHLIHCLQLHQLHQLLVEPAGSSQADTDIEVQYPLKIYYLAKIALFWVNLTPIHEFLDFLGGRVNGHAKKPSLRFATNRLSNYAKDI